MKLILKIFLILILLILSASSIYQFTLIQSLAKDIAQIKSTLELPSHSGFSGLAETTAKEDCADTCKKEISKEVASAVAKISITPIPTVAVEKQTAVSTQKLVSYIPLGTTGSISSTNWVTIEDSTVVIDLENDFGKNATVSWEASLKINNGSGSVFARLYDVTHGIAVDQSEIKADNNQTFLQVSSKNLPFWKGRNTYKVQLKSLYETEVTISGARLKVQY